MPEMPRETSFETLVMEIASRPPPAVPEEIPQPSPSRKSAAREGLESLTVILILALFGITFLVQAFQIPSSSMEDTLLIGDHVMVDKLSFSPHTEWLSPLLPYEQIHRGDV